MTHHIGNNQQPFTGDPWTCPQCTGSKDPNMPACDQCRTNERKTKHARRVIGMVAALGAPYGKSRDAINHCRTFGHNWRPTADWLIDRCSCCGEERA